MEDCHGEGDLKSSSFGKTEDRYFEIEASDEVT